MQALICKKQVDTKTPAESFPSCPCQAPHTASQRYPDTGLREDARAQGIPQGSPAAHINGDNSCDHDRVYGILLLLNPFNHFFRFAIHYILSKSSENEGSSYGFLAS